MVELEQDRVFRTFGTANGFEIAIRWVDDPEPVIDRPAEHGWSLGDLRLKVGGLNLTASRYGQSAYGAVRWYLGPVLSWLVDNWAPLLHEHPVSWPKKDASPAAEACRRALANYGGSQNDLDRSAYLDVQKWYFRHGLRSAAAGGLFPDVFLRRYEDDVEISWSGEQPPFAPAELVFEERAGRALLPVDDVAGPLWAMLTWVRDNPPPNLSAHHEESFSRLARRIEGLDRLQLRDIASYFVAPEILERASERLKQAQRSALLEMPRAQSGPFFPVRSPAVAMFGGLTPDLPPADVTALTGVLMNAEGGGDAELLGRLVRERRGAGLRDRPYEDGYLFATELLEDLEAEGALFDDEWIDVARICDALSIRVDDRELDTDSIRGVAVAGEGFHPTIVVNRTSPYNVNEGGRRFTIAHELCHILFDRTRARRISHASGPWAPVAIEQRANAFAAYFLMPREIVRRAASSAGPLDEAAVARMAARLRVNPSALVEHLYNIDIIDETQRERLRRRATPTNA